MNNIIVHVEGTELEVPHKWHFHTMPVLDLCHEKIKEGNHLIFISDTTNNREVHDSWELSKRLGNLFDKSESMLRLVFSKEMFKSAINHVENLSLVVSTDPVILEYAASNNIPVHPRNWSAK